MTDHIYDIFISYCRLDENGKISGRDQARLIAKQLELNNFHPFFDYSEIKDGEFDKAIIPAIEACMVFVLVLTKDCLNRCNNEKDWVRLEIESALRSGCKIINVTPDNSFNGWPDILPDSLLKIKTIEISDIHFGSLFEVSMDKLIEERILPVFSMEKKKISHKNQEKDFYDTVNRLFFVLIEVRNAFKSADQEKIIKVMAEFQQIVGTVFVFSEYYRYSNSDLSRKALSIADQYNAYTIPYNKWVNSDRVSERAQMFAKQTGKEFNKLIDIVARVLS